MSAKVDRLTDRW